MSIFSLKNILFPPIGSSSSQSLDNPLFYLQNKFDFGPTDRTKVEFKNVYFYSGERLTEYQVEGTMTKCNVNLFSGAEHSFELKCTPAVFQGIMAQLRESMLMAFNNGRFPLSARVAKSFEHFWSSCRKPQNNCFQVEEYAWDKRQRMKRYINLYQFINGAELTGRQTLSNLSKVVANIRFSATETECDDGLMVGIRTFMGVGIRIKELGGQPPVIASPWDWSNVDVRTLTTPLHPTIQVKTPALRVVDTVNDSAKIDMEAKPLYSKAVQELHEKAGANPWDGSIEIRGPLKPHAGAIIVATVSPTRNRNAILWHTKRYHVSARRHVKRGHSTLIPLKHRRPIQQKKQKTQGKTNHDNKDNSAVD